MEVRLIRILPLLAASLLAACGQPAAENAAAPAAEPVGGNALAQIAKLNPAQLQMVVFRAIRDAAQDCQDVTEVKPVGQLEGRTAWYATCRGRMHYLVAIGPDGVAHVTDGRNVRGTQ